MGTTDTKKSLTVRQPKGTELFTNELTDKQAIRLLKEAVKAKKLANSPGREVSVYSYEDATANGLTKCIIDYLNSQPFCYCGRISNEGVMRTNQYGKQFRAKSSMENGISDLDAIIYGRSVKIEVKIGRDVQSQDQKNYQKSIENAKGYYVIAKDFESFLDWFNLKMEAIKAKKGGENGG